MIESAAAAVGDGIIGVTVAEGLPPPDVLVEQAPVEAPAEQATAEQATAEQEPAPTAEPPAAPRRRGPLPLATKLAEMRGMYERRIARKRVIETRLAAELQELRDSIADDEAELVQLAARQPADVGVTSTKDGE